MRFSTFGIKGLDRELIVISMYIRLSPSLLLSPGKRSPQTEPVDYSASPRPLGSYELMAGDGDGLTAGGGQVVGGGGGGGPSCFSRDSSPDSAASPYMDVYGREANGKSQTVLTTKGHNKARKYCFRAFIFRLQPSSGHQLRHDAHRLPGGRQCLRHLFVGRRHISLCQSVRQRQHLDAGHRRRRRRLLSGHVQRIRYDGGRFVLYDGGGAHHGAALAVGQGERQGLVSIIHYLLNLIRSFSNNII